MSVWTHVAGIVRVDDIRFTDEIIDFDKVFGKSITFDDMWNKTPVYEEFDENPEIFMPFGSEGSLQKSVWVNPDKDCMASYTVSIFGDLRDYDSANAIKIWFKNRCDKIATRQAIITIEVEGREPITYRYKRSEEE